MTDGKLIQATLETVADRHGDPADLIFKHLFAAHPEYERLFEMDRDGGVRASMVQTGLECILNHVEGGQVARFTIAAERMHHDGYGVPEGEFDEFFVAMKAAFAEVMGEAWTQDVETAWSDLLAEFAAMV